MPYSQAVRTKFANLSEWRLFAVLVFIALTIVVGISYSPILDANFQGDDYAFLRYLVFNYKGLLDGVGWSEWLLSYSWFFAWPSAWPYLRPGVQLFAVMDYVTWGLNPFGYHLTNLILHILTAFLIFLLSWLMTKRRLAAVGAGTIFALLPIHVEAVSWFAARADGLSAVWYLISLVFFILFRRRGRGLFIATSAFAFVIALSTKEVAVTLPFLLLVFDLLYSHSGLRKLGSLVWAHLPFWILLAAYLGLRLFQWRQMVDPSLPNAANIDWDFMSQLYVLALADPFLSDMTSHLRSILVGIAVLIVLIYWRRREVGFSAVWMASTILPSLLSANQTIFDRYVYLPSAGLSIALASILTDKSLKRLQPLGLFALGLLVLAYGKGLYERNQEWARAAAITQAVTEQVRTLHPVFAENSRLVFTNVPILVGGRQMQAFANDLPFAMQTIYRDKSLQVYNFARLPLWLDNLDRTYFFEYNRRKITERSDLLRALEQRKQCANVTRESVTWDFAQADQGWEPWNQLSAFQVVDRTLKTRSDGNDPFMVSPLFDIPALAIADVEITMGVRSNGDSFEGEVFWLGKGQEEFSPGLRESFQGKADGEYHTYRVEIGNSGKLALDDHIVRLRLDPTNAPGDIELKSIRVNVHCATAPDRQCQCSGGVN